MTHRRRPTRGRLARLARARQETALLLTGAAFLGSFVIIGMNAPSIYHAALAQMEEMKAEYQHDPVRDAEQHLGNVRRQIQDRRRELKNNFRGTKLDVSSIEALLTQWEQAIETELAPLLEEARSTGDTSAFWNLNQDFDYDHQQPVDGAFREFYAQQSYIGLKREIADKLNEVKKNMPRMLKDLTRRAAKGHSIDTAGLQAMIGESTAAITALEQQYNALNPSDEYFSDSVEDIRSALHNEIDTSTFYDEWGTWNDQVNMAGSQKDAKLAVKQMKRTFKNLDRKLLRYTRKKLPTEELRVIISELELILHQMEKVASAPLSEFDPDEYVDLREQWGNGESQVWDIINGFERWMYQSRWLKDTKRELTNLERIVSDTREQAKHGGTAAEVLPELEGLLTEMEDVFSRATEASRAKDDDEVEDLIQDLEGLKREFYDAQSSLYEEMQEVQSLPSREEIEKLAAMLEAALQKVGSTEKAGTISPEVAGICRSTFEEARKIVSEILVTFDRGGDAAELFQRLQAVGEKLDPQCQGFVQ